MLKFKHKKKGPKGRPRTTLSGELNDDLSDPMKAARVEWVLDLYGEMLQRITIIRKVIAGRKADLKKGYTEIPPVSNAEAYRYFNLAMRLNDAEFKADREEKRKWHRSQLIALARQARKLRQPGTAASILERAAAFDGVSIDGTVAHPPKNPGELTDEELASRIAEETARKLKKPDAAP